MTPRRAARAIPFAEDVVAAWYCAIDPATPPVEGHVSEYHFQRKHGPGAWYGQKKS